MLVGIGIYNKRKIEHPTSDVEWGSSVRSFQMLLANYLWSNTDLDPNSDVQPMFHDNYRYQKAPFSIQNVAKVALKYGVYPGEEYLLETCAKVFRDLNVEYQPAKDFKLVCFENGVVDLDKLAASGVEQSS